MEKIIFYNLDPIYTAKRLIDFLKWKLTTVSPKWPTTLVY